MKWYGMKSQGHQMSCAGSAKPCKTGPERCPARATAAAIAARATEQDLAPGQTGPVARSPQHTHPCSFICSCSLKYRQSAPVKLRLDAFAIAVVAFERTRETSVRSTARHSKPRPGKYPNYTTTYAETHRDPHGDHSRSAWRAALSCWAGSTPRWTCGSVKLKRCVDCVSTGAGAAAQRGRRGSSARQRRALLRPGAGSVATRPAPRSSPGDPASPAPPRRSPIRALMADGVWRRGLPDDGRVAPRGGPYEEGEPSGSHGGGGHAWARGSPQRR